MNFCDIVECTLIIGFLIKIMLAPNSTIELLNQYNEGNEIITFTPRPLPSRLIAKIPDTTCLGMIL